MLGMIGLFDPLYLLFAAPAFLLGLYAQWRIRSAYGTGQRVPARMNGAQAAQMMLDASGLGHVGIEETSGHLSDHYDPRAKVLRLSREVYHGRTAASVGIAAHEAGHALQDAHNYMPLIIRNAAVPAANIGSQLGTWMLFGGIILSAMGTTFGMPVFFAGIVLFGFVVFFQLVNLPVEFDASSRARGQLLSMGILTEHEMPYVRAVLNAAALTYVAATLQALMTLLYYILRFSQMQSRD
jgi:Zn-dependent membrane protease YugP